MPISTPPTDYKLERAGTSGVVVGPELCILGEEGASLSAGKIGRICLRGEGVFPGYLRQSEDGTKIEFDRSCFDNNGWFDTGDLGYLAADGFLFITGRSKEVINRGGEIISPFEIEDAIISAAQNPSSPIFGRVSQALAFSVRHTVLQEVGGVVLVTPSFKPRVDTRQLHQALRTSLQKAKWPVLIVYMENLPRQNSKVLRIGLAERMAIPELSDITSHSQLHWVADCPKPETPIPIPISSSPCEVSEIEVGGVLSSLLPPDIRALVRRDRGMGHLTSTIFSVSLPGNTGMADRSLRATVDNLKSQLPSLLHGYLIPHKFTCLNRPIPLNDSGGVRGDVLEQALSLAEEHVALGEEQPTANQVACVFASVLGCYPSEVDRDADFLTLGGDSLRAGRLLSALRSGFAVSLPVSLLFQGASVNSLAKFIDERLLESSCPEKLAPERLEPPLPSHVGTCSSTNPFLLVLHLVPLAILYPARRSAQWTIFLLSLAFTKTLATSESVVGRLFNVVACLLVTRIIILTGAPFIGIVVKWLVIGRHKEGLFPMWGLYHTRWWIVQKTVDVCGLGVWR